MTGLGVHLVRRSFRRCDLAYRSQLVLLIVAAERGRSCANQILGHRRHRRAGAAVPRQTAPGTRLAANWNTDSTGLGIPTTWTAGNIAVFAAGTNATGAYTVTVTGTQSLSGLTVEEGTITQNGGTLDFGGTFSAPINIASGAGWGQNSTSVITGTDGIVKSGAGTLVLRGTNTFTRTGTGNQAVSDYQRRNRRFHGGRESRRNPSATDNGAALIAQWRHASLQWRRDLCPRRQSRREHWPQRRHVRNCQRQHSRVAGRLRPPPRALTGSGTITKTGSGRFRLQTAQTTFTGKYVVKGGSLTFPSEDRLGAVPASTQADYFTLDGGGLMVISATGATLDAKRGITLGPSGGYLAFYGTGLSPYDGIISGTQGGGVKLTPNDAMQLQFGTGTHFVELRQYLQRTHTD